MNPEIRPILDADPLKEYIDRHWRQGHVLSADSAMFDFTYRTPWVDQGVFPAGISVLGLFDGSELLGFLGSIVTPYPRPQSYWLALWHVHESLKGQSFGGRLLESMQNIASRQMGWLGTFGAGPEALPVYLKRGYCVRAARRWVYEPEGENENSEGATRRQRSINHPSLHSAELLPNDAWIDYRYRQHPRYGYEFRPGGVFRTEHNRWGMVTHVCMLGLNWEGDVREIYHRSYHAARQRGNRYLMDAWSFVAPGPGWRLADEKLPSVFHPPECRGNLIYAIGNPFLVSRIHKGDCDQDRPNCAASESLAEVLSA